MTNFERTSRDLRLVALVLSANVLAGIYTGRSTTFITTFNDTITSKSAATGVMATTTMMRREFKVFTQLPVEIRELVYEQAMRQGGHFALPTHVKPRAKLNESRGLKYCLPAVCFTSRTEGSIATSVFIRGAKFHLYRGVDATILTRWLTAVNGGNDFRSIRQVDIEYMHRYRQNGFLNDTKLLENCPGLREVTISIPLEALNFTTYDHAHRPMSKRPHTGAELLSKFQFAGIVECERLQSVTFRIGSKYTFEFASRLPLYYDLMQLLQWMQKGSTTRHGRNIEMTVLFSQKNGETLGY